MQAVKHCQVCSGGAHARTAGKTATAAGRLVGCAATLVLGLPLLTAGAPAAASESFRLCGPESMGFIRTGRQITCVGGSLNWRRRPRRPAAAAGATASGTAPERATQAVAGGSNKDVDDALNSADIQFRDGEQELGCRWVNNAISAANSNVGGKPSRNQEEQLRSYAKDCNLRY